MSEVNKDFLEYGASFIVTKRDYLYKILNNINNFNY